MALAVLVPIAASVSVNLSYAVIMSTYRTMDKNGVIDREKLSKVWGQKIADDWGLAVKRLIGEPLSGLFRFSFYISALFVLNGVLLIAMWNQRTKELPNKTQ